MKQIVKIGFLIFILSSCSTGRIVTTNLQDLTSYEPNSRIYNLPQTRIVFTALAQKNYIIPGPYQKYAKEFLGVDAIQHKKSTRWNLIDIKINTFLEPDPEQYYSVVANGKIKIDDILEELTGKGYISARSDLANYQLFDDNAIKKIEDYPFTDLSIKPFYLLEDKKDQKNILEDSAFAMIPALENQLAVKSDKEIAFEAAQFILKIRKRRFKLMSGQYEVFPEGIAMAKSIEELNKLEEKYLSLFIGKTYTDTVAHVFSVVPVPESETLQRINLFNFSEENGFYTSEGEGIPVILEIKDLNQNEMLGRLQIPRINSTYQDLLFYRQPDKAKILLFYGSHLIVESEVSVSQFGVLVPYYIKPGER